MTERLETPEKRARAAIAEYAHVTPQIDMWQIPPAMLKEWREACAGVDLEPDELRQLGWMHMESAMSLTTYGAENGLDPAALGVAIHDQTAAAREAFTRAYNHLHIDALTKTIVDRDVTAALVLEGLLTDRMDIVMKKYKWYKKSHYKILEQALEAYADNENVESFHHILAASAALLVVDASSNFIPLAVPPRLSSFGIDGTRRTHLAAMRVPSGEIRRITIGHDVPSWHAHVPVELMRVRPERAYDDLAFPLDLVRHSAVVYDGIAERQTPAVKIRTQTVDRIRSQVLRRLEEQFDGGSPVEPHEPAIANPFEWYDALPALQHPFVVDVDKLEAALSEAELRKINGELPAEAAQTAGWMYIESGVGRALQPGASRLLPQGDFDAAEAMLIHADEQYETQSIARFEGLLAQAALPMYRAVICGEEPPFDHYTELLAVLGDSLKQYQATLEASSPDAIRADELLQTITACLVYATDPTSSFVVVPSSPRQQGARGWHLTTWEVTNRGFEPTRFGRIRFEEGKKSGAHFYDGNAIMSVQALGQKNTKKRTVTLQALIDQVTGAPISERDAYVRTRTIDRIRGDLLTIATASR